METQILEVLRQSQNGLRLREIAMYLRVNRFALINDLDELHKAGLVKGIRVNNFAQGESYIIWQAVE
jgi:DNA-binding Lrp family transcriptional regulator